MPDRKAPLVTQYVRKIEGSNKVDRAKKDTYNAIDLLYIAYNTTPQEEGRIRVQISQIMDDLIKAQQESERAMNDATRTADRIIKSLENTLPDWLDVRQEVTNSNLDGLKSFVKTDLREIAIEISKEATVISEKLIGIANAYDKILQKTTIASDESEKALSARLTDKRKIESEINQMNSDRARLDQLVKELQDEVMKFEKQADEDKGLAGTAEERAFIMQIVQVGAQIIASAIPPLVMAGTAGATGGASLLAGAALGGGRKQDGNGDTADDAPGTAAAEVATKTEISEKQQDLKEAEANLAESEESVKDIRDELKKVQGRSGRRRERNCSGRR